MTQQQKAEQPKTPTPVTEPRPDYGEAYPRWEMVRDVCAGQWRIKERSLPNYGQMGGAYDANFAFGRYRNQSGYLPYLNPWDTSEQNVIRNIQYARRAVFYGVTGHTRDALIGLAFRKDPTFVAPKGAEYLAEDCNENGVSIYQQSQQVLDDLLVTGRAGIYVDFHNGATRADDRVTILSYKTEDIINWRVARIGGRMMLTMVVLREWVDEPEGFGTAHVERYRELSLENGVFVARVWEKNGSDWAPGEDIIPNDSSGKPWDEIPFSFIGARNNNPDIDTAPLYDLAELNLAHYRNSADYEDTVYYCGQAQPWIVGVSTDWIEKAREAGVYIGSRAPIALPVGGQFGFASANPNPMVRDAMAQKEAQMIALGARLLITGRGNMATATEITSDREATTSVLSLCVANVSEAYTRALQWCARYVGDASENASYEIDGDFAIDPADPQLLSQLLASLAGGVIATSDVRAWMRTVGILDTERSDDDIQEEIDETTPNAGKPPAAAPAARTGSGYPDGTPAASVADSGLGIPSGDITLA